MHYLASLALAMVLAGPALATQDGTFENQPQPVAARQLDTDRTPVLFRLVGRAIVAVTYPVRTPLVWAFTSPVESAQDRRELASALRGR